jgi:hypothetical protein
VEYNTSTNPTFEAAVRDTSGRGNDGVFVNQTYYDANEKSFEFDGSGDYIETFNIGNPVGESLFSGSFWYNPIVPSSDSFVWIGGQEGVGKAFILKYNNPNFEFSFYGNDAIFNYTLNGGAWYHIAFAYSGGTASSGRRMWVNGVEVAYTSGASSTALNLDANTELRIGGRINNNNDDLIGSISNFKLYDTALTASEVKTLYDMGRCDEGHHMVNFSKTRVGIGLGDGEVPRSLLDVGGEPVGPGSRPAFLVSKFSSGGSVKQWGQENSTYTTIYASPLPIFAESDLVYNINNCLSFGDYASRKYIKFTAPADGIYNFGLAIGLLQNVHSAADYVSFGLKVNLEGAYSSTTTPGGAAYTNLDYFFEEIDSVVYGVNIKRTVNATINVKLLKGDFVTYYSRSVANSEIEQGYSAWGHIVHYL